MTRFVRVIASGPRKPRVDRGEAARRPRFERARAMLQPPVAIGCAEHPRGPDHPAQNPRDRPFAAQLVRFCWRGRWRIRSPHLVGPRGS